MDRIYKALGDPHRLQMVSLLGQSDCTVDQLRSDTGMSQSSTSQHLKVLLKAGLVSYKKHGNFRLYALERKELMKAMHFFDTLWDEGLLKLKTRLENE